MTDILCSSFRWFKFEEVQQPGDPIEIRILVGNEIPDYEQAQRVDLSIRVVDSKTAPGFEDKSESIAVLSVNILNVNDVKPVIEEPRNIRVTETQTKKCEEGEVCECEGEGCNDESARFIYTFRATDADNLPGQSLVFSVT